ncbi:MAG: hypothetical protein ACKOZY_10340, partial [Flavobacteriales bacterium]
MIKVHVISNINTDPEVYSNLRNILQSHAGPVQYYFPNEQTETQEEGEDKEFSDSKKFSIKEEMVFTMRLETTESRASIKIDPPKEAYSFPITKKVHTWTSLFRECDMYREIAKIPAEDHVILLTPEYNDSNWFGGADERGNNYFVHSVGWNFYLGGSA